MIKQWFLKKVHKKKQVVLCHLLLRLYLSHDLNVAVLRQKDFFYHFISDFLLFVVGQNESLQQSLCLLQKSLSGNPGLDTA